MLGDDSLCEKYHLFPLFQCQGTSLHKVSQQKLFNLSCIPGLTGAEAGFAAGGSQLGFTELHAVLLVESRWASGTKNSDALQCSCSLCSQLIFAYQLQQLFRSATLLALRQSSLLLCQLCSLPPAPLHPDSKLFLFLSTQHLCEECHEQLGFSRQLLGLTLALESRGLTAAR